MPTREDLIYDESVVNGETRQWSTAGRQLGLNLSEVAWALLVDVIALADSSGSATIPEDATSYDTLSSRWLTWRSGPLLREELLSSGLVTYAHHDPELHPRWLNMDSALWNEGFTALASDSAISATISSEARGFLLDMMYAAAGNRGNVDLPADDLARGSLTTRWLYGRTGPYLREGLRTYLTYSEASPLIVQSSMGIVGWGGYQP